MMNPTYIHLMNRIDRLPKVPHKTTKMDAALPKALRDAGESLDVRSALNADPWLDEPLDGAVDQVRGHADRNGALFF
jgi:hypothetical protein